MVKDIKITQGSTFEMLALINDVNGVPLDMTGFVGGTAGARGMYRKNYTDTTPLETFNISILNKTGVTNAISVGTCHITTAEIDALQPDTAGKCYLLIRLTAVETAALAKGTGVYDIEVEDVTGFVFKPFTGAVTVGAEATR